MEQHIATNITDALVPGLDFSGGAPSAEYVKQARQVRWRAQAGDRFSDAAKTIRFNLSDDCWLQSCTLRLQFSITNKDAAKILTPVAHPMAMFENVRLYIGGQVAENMDNVTVLGNLLDLFKPVTRRVAESLENHPSLAMLTRALRFKRVRRARSSWICPWASSSNEFGHRST